MSGPTDYLRGVPGPTSAQMAGAMPDIGHGLCTRLTELWRDPTPERCDDIAASLWGARVAVLRLREELLRDMTPPDAA